MTANERLEALILDALPVAPAAVDLATLARAIGRDPTGVRKCLTGLIAAGAVRAEKETRKTRPSLVGAGTCYRVAVYSRPARTEV